MYDESTNTLTKQLLLPEYQQEPQTHLYKAGDGDKEIKKSGGTTEKKEEKEETKEVRAGPSTSMTTTSTTTKQDNNEEEEEKNNPFAGDYTECTIHFNPSEPASFAHPTTTTLFYSKVIRRTSSSSPHLSSSSPSSLSSLFAIKNIFSFPMPHVIRYMLFSPKGTYLATYSWMDTRRPNKGNLFIFHTETGKLCCRALQAVWPALSWTADEEYLVRYTQGELQVLKGNQLHLSEPSSPSCHDNTSSSSFSLPPAMAATPTPTTMLADVFSSALSPVLSSLPIKIGKEKELEFSCAPSPGFPFLGVFKPFEEGQPAVFFIFRLPQMKEASDAFVHITFGRAEAATIMWSPSGKYVALLVKQSTSAAATPLASVGEEKSQQNGKKKTCGWGSGVAPTSLSSIAGGGGRGGAGGAGSNSYYGKLTVSIVDVRRRTVVDVKLKSVLGGGSSSATAAAAAHLDVVHDCCWRPRVVGRGSGGCSAGAEVDELLVIHGNMPRNRATLVNAADGLPLVSYGEGPRNMIRWSPDGRDLLVGGSGNLAGDYQFYSDCPDAARAFENDKAFPKPSSPPDQEQQKSRNGCIGEINEKCSVERWAPDNYHILFSTIFTRLRVDNKIVIAKKNGVKRLTEKFKALYGAYWVPPEETEEEEEEKKREMKKKGDEKEVYRPYRAASPKPLEAQTPKAQAYRPPGRVNTTALPSGVMSSNHSGSASTVVRSVGLIGGQVAVPTKKKRR